MYILTALVSVPTGSEARVTGALLISCKVSCWCCTATVTQVEGLMIGLHQQKYCGAERTRENGREVCKEVV
jgi:hypothetical protein